MRAAYAHASCCCASRRIARLLRLRRMAWHGMAWRCTCRCQDPQQMYLHASNQKFFVASLIASLELPADIAVPPVTLD